MSATGHRQIDHTADLALEIWAPTEVELLAEAARAVVAIMTEGRAVDGDAVRELELDPVDAEDRLVQWVNEIIYLAVTEGFVVADCELDLQSYALRAKVRGQPDASDRIAGELKSATYHDLALEQRENGWWARLVIDV
jgi:SHS2 domain-containing protein